MTWPLSQDYNEVIQDPRQSFSDTELKTGEAVTNALGIPMPRSGNFADVYEMRSPSGTRWAVKCFTREVHGLRERYAEISKYLKQANLPFTVDFQYLEQGIRIRGQWYPILKMQWVEGFVLNEFVRDNLDKKQILQALGQVWLRMARRLREAKLAHCDLQHGNVMFVPGSSSNSLAVKLIDYDGMWVPALANKKSGEVGHPAYQHPERIRTGVYNREIDRFSLLIIAEALRCVTIGGRSLWERYDNGDNLLFRQADLQAPKESPLFQELLAIRDPQAQMLVKELRRACEGSLAKVPLLTDLVSGEKPAGKMTKRVAASSSLLQRLAEGPSTDWDFGYEEPSTRLVKNRRIERRVPLWVWGALGGAGAVVLLSIGVVVGLLLNKGPSEKPIAPVAQNKPAAEIPNPKATIAPQPPANEGAVNPPPPQPAKPKPDEDNKPVNANPPPIPANQEPVAEPVQRKRIFQLAPGGDKLAIADEGDKTWKLIDPRTNQVIRTFSGHEKAIAGLSFSADGRLALTGSEDGTLRQWDATTGAMLHTLADLTPLAAVALSPDGQKALYIRADRPSTCYQQGFEEKEPYVSSFGGHRILSLVFSGDNEGFLAGVEQADNNRHPMLWKYTMPGVKIFRNHPDPLNCVAGSPDGQFAASGHSGGSPSVVLWDASTCKQLWEAHMPTRPIRQLLFSPDNRFLLAEARGAFRVFQVSNGQQLGGRDWPQDALTSGGFSSDGKQALCASYKNGTVRLQSIPLP